jgi:hypothetical protein
VGPESRFCTINAQAEVFGRLAVQFPHLVAMSIDDFTHDVSPPHGLFTPQLLAEIVNSLHRNSPTINFAPLVYLLHNQHRHISLRNWQIL